ncbi:MAG: APC family permease, partial [Mariprofundaceae bacterium]|nr:APC family permease [Mariprofundaceae bacterium]
MVNHLSNQLGLKELIAIGTGGMIGGGIFSVLGLAVAIAGNAAPLAFLLGGLLAMLTGYSYIRLALAFHSDGASFTYLEHAFPDHPFIGALTGWTVIVGYIGTLALYAFTFGAYTAELLHAVDSDRARQALSIAIIIAFVFINLRGARSSGLSEDIIVYSKVILLGILVFAGMNAVDMHRFEPFAMHGETSIIMAGALIFVAFEGFELITNAVCEAEHPEKNIPLAIYVSVAVVTLLYVLITVVAVGSLDVQVMIDAKEYALAVAAEPA